MVRPNSRVRRCGQALVLAAVLSGCAQLLGGDTKLPQRRYFKLPIEPLRGSVEGSERPYPFQVQVKSFEVPRAYDRTNIIRRRDQYELQRDNLHHWMERPSDMITDAVKQYLRQADLFIHVGGEHDFFDHRPDYVLSGSVKAIERFDSGDLWAVHLVMTMELVRQADGKVIWQDDFDEEKQVFSPAMKHSVAALSGILGQRMKKAIEDIDFKFLNKQRPTPVAPIASDGETAPAARDTVLQTEAGHYELIPGKLAP